MLITDPLKLKAFYSDNRVWQLVPTIERTKRGRLFATFYSGAATETLGNYCVLVKSDDDGKHWTEPIAVAYDGEMHRCFDPVVWIDPLDRLWFTWSRGHEDGVYGVICENPEADELVWSEEKYLGKNVMMNKPTVLSTGEWLFPIAIWNFYYVDDTLKQQRAYTDLYVEKYFNNKDHLSGANIVCSVDNGNTFFLLGGCHNIQNRSCDEHIIYEKSNGVLVMMIRTMAGIARSYSYDRGRTWTDAEKFEIPAPQSRFHIKRLKSGRLLMITHYNFDRCRENLAAFLSEDDGKTWPYRVLFDGRKEISYPDVAEGEDGYIYIIYDRERGGYAKDLADAQSNAREILVRKINESDIINGEITSPGSYEPQIVSKLGEYKGTRDYYTAFPYIDPKEFVESVSGYHDVEQILEHLFVYYSDSFLNTDHDLAKEIDDLLERLKLCAVDNSGLRSYLTEIVIKLESVQLKPYGDKKAELVDSMIDFLNQNSGRQFNLRGFAEENSVSVYYLCYIFKKRTGFDIYAFMDICRKKKFKELLITTDLNLEQICEKASISNVSTFVGEFIRSENITPEQYRRYNKF